MSDRPNNQGECAGWNHTMHGFRTAGAGALKYLFEMRSAIIECKRNSGGLDDYERGCEKAFDELMRAGDVRDLCFPECGKTRQCDGCRSVFS